MKNVTGFLDHDNNICDDYVFTVKEMINSLHWYYEMFTG